MSLSVPLSLCLGAVDYNKSSAEYHQIWYDDPTSLAKKYEWTASEKLRGVGMWVPSTTLYDREVARAMWAAVPA